MAQDVSADVAGLISGSKVFGGSDNIRHGKYIFLIKRVFAQLVEVDSGQHRMAFWELTPVKSEVNQQVEGDHVDYPGVSGPLKDDGTKPNAVGSNCALKVDFDGAGSRSAGSNIKAAILGLFGKHDGQIPDDEINKTWADLSRVVDLKVGDAIGINPANNQPIFATMGKRSNWACGMLIACSTINKRKKTANEKGAFITKMLWSCVDPPGVGQNAWELVEKRRLEIEATRIDDDEEEVKKGPTPSPYGQAPAPAASPYAPPAGFVPPQPVSPTPAPPPPAAPPPPVAATVAPFVPPTGWFPHPNAQPPGPTPDTRWYWNGETAKNETQLRNGA